jgi:hypothetical protein
MDRGVPGWDRLAVPATTLRHAPVPPHAAVAAAAVAVVAGGWLTFLIVVAATGGEVGAGAALWVGLSGGAASMSGVILGSTGRAAPAAAVAAAAVAGMLLAGAAPQPHNRGGEWEAAFRAREQRAETAPPGERDAQRSRGNAPTREQVVRSFYAALDAHRFAQAWAQLSPGVQAAFGSFDTWRHGYDSTLGHRLEDVTAEPGGVVRHVLVATDRTPCGGRTEQRFAVTWRLARAGRDRQATSLSAVKLAGVDPTAAC